MRRSAGWAAAVALLLGGTACFDESITGDRPLNINIEADDSTPEVGQTVRFVFTATASNLNQVLVEYGDGESDTKTYFATISVTDIVLHAYEAEGAYTVVARASARQGTVSDTITITVTAG